MIPNPIPPEVESRWNSLLARIESGNVEGEARDLVAALAFAAVGAVGDPGPGLIQARPRRPALISAAGEASLSGLFPELPRASRLTLSAGLLQMLDAWDASHECSQEAGDLGEKPHSAYWHAIAHRREPDPGNAAYWFRRVGVHPIFPGLAEDALAILREEDVPEAAPRLVSGGKWNPMAFVEFCTEMARKSGSSGERAARRIQRVEMIRLLDATLAS